MNGSRVSSGRSYRYLGSARFQEFVFEVSQVPGRFQRLQEVSLKGSRLGRHLAVGDAADEDPIDSHLCDVLLCPNTSQGPP